MVAFSGFVYIFARLLHLFFCDGFGFCCLLFMGCCFGVGLNVWVLCYELFVLLCCFVVFEVGFVWICMDLVSLMCFVFG